MKKRQLKSLQLNKKSVSKLQANLLHGGDLTRQDQDDDMFQTIGCTFNFACWSIGCPSDLCTSGC